MRNGHSPYVSFVRGLQGDDAAYLKLVATPKHFAVHSGPEALRHSFDAVVSAKDLRETYLPAFHACITEAEAESIMGAYNRTNGEPCCASQAASPGRPLRVQSIKLISALSRSPRLPAPTSAARCFARP